MEMNPGSSPAKRTRAKPKVVSQDSVEAKPAAKKPRAPRKSPTTQSIQAEMPTVGSAPEDVGSMIATAAYYLAAARNFMPGHELEDWLEAERVVHAKLYG